MQMYYDTCVWVLVGLHSALAPQFYATITAKGKTKDDEGKRFAAAVDTLVGGRLCECDDGALNATPSGMQVAEKLLDLYGSQLGRSRPPRRPSRARRTET